MRLLLFGGSGFVSGRVLRFAIEQGHDVIAITRGEMPMPESEGFRHIQADRNDATLHEIADEYEFDAVLDVICQTPEHASQAVGVARHCKRLIMVSSDYAYDPAHRTLALSESQALVLRTGRLRRGKSVWRNWYCSTVSRKENVCPLFSAHHIFMVPEATRAPFLNTAAARTSWTILRPAKR